MDGKRWANLIWIICAIAFMVAFNDAKASEDITPPEYVDMGGKELSSLECLAVNAYHESRSESDYANMLVMAVVLNRVDDSRYPDDICSVIFQNKQFSWTHDGKSDRIKNVVQYERLYNLAEHVLINRTFVQDFSEGVTHYHTVSTSPYWSRDGDIQYVQTIDRHKFYRWRK